MADKKNNNSTPFNLSFFEEQSKASQPQTFETYEKPNISKYDKILQNVGTNGLMTISNKTEPTRITLTGIATLPTANPNVIATISNYANNKLSPNDLIFLQYLLTKFTANVSFKEPLESKIDKSREITLTLDEYMEWRNLTDKKEAKKSIKTSLDILFNTALEWTQDLWTTPPGKKRKVKEPVKLSMRLVDTMAESFSFNKGRAVIKLNYDMAKILTQNGQIEPIPKALGQIKTNRNPNSLYIINKLISHYNMNIGKTNEHSISVATLLKCCPNIPNYEEIKTKGKVQQKIMIPFDRDLENLEELAILKEYTYYKADNTPLNSQELEKALTDYKIFISLMVHFELAEDTLLDEMRQAKLDKITKARIDKKARELDKADRVAKAQKKNVKEQG